MGWILDDLKKSSEVLEVLLEVLLNLERQTDNAEKMPLIPPQRLRAVRIAELRGRLLRIRARERAVVLALLAEEEAQAEERRARRPRTMWVKPWIGRRPLYGTYDNLIQVVISFQFMFLSQLHIISVLANEN